MFVFFVEFASCSVKTSRLRKYVTVLPKIEKKRTEPVDKEKFEDLRREYEKTKSELEKSEARLKKETQEIKECGKNSSGRGCRN